MALNKLGRYLAIILSLIFLVQLLIVWNKDCKFAGQTPDFGICINKLILLLIPTEGGIVEFFEHSPLFMLIILFLYWKFVAPHEK